MRALNRSNYGFPRWERVECGRFSSRKVPTFNVKGAGFDLERCRLSKKN